MKMKIYLIHHLAVTVSLKKDLRNWYQLKSFTSIHFDA